MSVTTNILETAVRVASGRATKYSKLLAATKNIYILKNNKISTAPDEFQRLLCSCVGLCFCDPVLREMDAAAPHRVSPPIPHV